MVTSAAATIPYSCVRRSGAVFPRPGNVHSATVGVRFWNRSLSVIGNGTSPLFRGDAAFAAPDIYEFLESEGFLYAIRLPKNQILQESIAHLLTRPVGRPPNHVRRYYASFRYQAGSWDRKRRVVAKVEWRPGELCPRVASPTCRGPPNGWWRFIITVGQRSSTSSKYAIKWTRLSASSATTR